LIKLWNKNGSCIDWNAGCLYGFIGAVAEAQAKKRFLEAKRKLRELNSMPESDTNDG